MSANPNAQSQPECPAFGCCTPRAADGNVEAGTILPTGEGWGITVPPARSPLEQAANAVRDAKDRLDRIAEAQRELHNESRRLEEEARQASGDVALAEANLIEAARRSR